MPYSRLSDDDWVRAEFDWDLFDIVDVLFERLAPPAGLLHTDTSPPVRAAKLIRQYDTFPGFMLMTHTNIMHHSAFTHGILSFIRACLMLPSLSIIWSFYDFIFTSYSRHKATHTAIYYIIHIYILLLFELMIFLFIDYFDIIIDIILNKYYTQLAFSFTPLSNAAFHHKADAMPSTMTILPTCLFSTHISFILLCHVMEAH